MRDQACLVWDIILFDAEMDQKGRAGWRSWRQHDRTRIKLTELEVIGLVEPASAVP